jgi:hypothetical protein
VCSIWIHHIHFDIMMVMKCVMWKNRTTELMFRIIINIIFITINSKYCKHIFKKSLSFLYVSFFSVSLSSCREKKQVKKRFYRFHLNFFDEKNYDFVNTAANQIYIGWCVAAASELKRWWMNYVGGITRRVWSNEQYHHELLSIF